MIRIRKIANAVLPHVILVTAVILVFGILLGVGVVVAQQPGGGLNVTLIMQCTCGPGYLALVIGYGSTSSGLYYFGPQTQYWVGSGYGPAFWLGYYTPSAGFCLMNASIACFTITGNLMLYYGGSS